MDERDWFGFRTVTRGSRIWHGFKTDQYGQPSLCGRVRFGAPAPGHRRGEGRACAPCAAAWAKRYPKVDR